MPFTYVLSFIFMRLSGMPLPTPAQVSLTKAPSLFLLYGAGAAGEELGWTGYATEPLQRRWGPPRGALILGVVWVIWHAIPYKQTGNSTRWIVWQSLGSVARRVLLVWSYDKAGGSVFATILVHAMDNVSWSLFPNDGSHYNPAVTTIVTCVTAAFFVRRWGFASHPRDRRAIA
jgi:membrane protease YdiL (CAAX protease family)